MKLVSMVIVFALALASLGVACGPEQTYCYDQHKTCEQAQLERDKEIADRKAMEEAARDALSPPSDGGATVVD